MPRAGDVVEAGGCGPVMRWNGGWPTTLFGEDAPTSALPMIPGHRSRLQRELFPSLAQEVGAAQPPSPVSCAIEDCDTRTPSVTSLARA